MPINRFAPLVALMAALWGAGCAGGREPESGRGGSLEIANHGNFAAAIRVGRIASYGDLLVLNRGRSPVTLESVTWEEEPAGGVEVSGQLVAGADRRETLGFDFGFPPAAVRGVAAPLRGHVLRPAAAEDAAQILLAVRATRSGRNVLRRFRVAYREQDGKRRVLKAPGSLTLCAPEGVPCPAPAP